jgi:hypothetical protein
LRFFPVFVLFAPVIESKLRRPNRRRSQSFPVFVLRLTWKLRASGCARHPVFFLLFAGTAGPPAAKHSADEGGAYFAGLGFELRSGAPPGLNPKLPSSSSAA